MVDDNASKLVLDKFFDWAAATREVPQGSVLGLLLFNVFVNDLHFNVTKAELNTYADDNSISATICPIKLEGTLNDELDSTLKCCIFPKIH